MRWPRVDLLTSGHTTHPGVYGIGAQGSAEGPENGDIVIRVGKRDVGPSYVIHERSGPDQLKCATLAQAIDVARSYARHANVDVWSGDGSTDGFTLMARFRGSSRPMPPPAMSGFPVTASRSQQMAWKPKPSVRGLSKKPRDGSPRAKGA